jgi:hypothetical protein
MSSSVSGSEIVIIFSSDLSVAKIHKTLYKRNAYTGFLMGDHGKLPTNKSMGYAQAFLSVIELWQEEHRDMLPEALLTQWVST